MNNDEELKKVLMQMATEENKTVEHSEGDKYIVIKLLVFVVSVIVIIWSMGNIFKKDSTNKNNSTDYKLEAYVMSQDFMKKHLTSPSTANFPNYTKVNVVQTNNRYKVEAYVESNNSFGTKVKNNYYMILERSSDGGWNEISCDIK